jgi:hypothetical protein
VLVAGFFSATLFYFPSIEPQLMVLYPAFFAVGTKFTYMFGQNVF